MWTCPPSPTNNTGVFSFPLPSFTNFLWHLLLCVRLAKSLFLGPKKLIFIKLLRLLLGWIFSKHDLVVSMHKRLKSERSAAYNSPMLCPSPYACTQPNRPCIMAALGQLPRSSGQFSCGIRRICDADEACQGQRLPFWVLWLNPCVRWWTSAMGFQRVISCHCLAWKKRGLFKETIGSWR